MSFYADDLERKGGRLAAVRPRVAIPWPGGTLRPETSRLSVDHEAVRAAPELFDVVTEPVRGQNPGVVRERAARTRAVLVKLLHAAERDLTDDRRRGQHRRDLVDDHACLRLPRSPRPLRLP